MESTLMKYEALSDVQRERVLEIEVPAEQKILVGDVYGALHTLAAQPAADIQGYVLLIAEIPRGFFLIKRRSLLPRWAEGSTATLHALMIDHRFQGAGLGRKCMGMLPNLVRSLWPETAQIMLAVDPRNQAAYRLYKTLGWQDCGDADLTAAGFERRMVLRAL